MQAPNLSGPLPPSRLPTCDAEKLYYGDGVHKADYAGALQCGWYQRAHPDPSVGNMFQGPGILTMLYANGQGVQRNFDLAIRLACENDWTAEAEQEMRIGHLEGMQNGTLRGTFDLCDDITSGMNMGSCEAVSTMQHAGTRDTKIAEQFATLPPSAQGLAPALRNAEKAFEETRANKEIDMSGTARSMYYEQEVDTLQAQFLINLQRFGKSDVPPATAQDLATLDAKLNTTYQSLMHAPASRWQDNGTVKPDGIRETERAWLRLVDAWVKFSHEAYPHLTETSLRAQLTRLRLHQLHSLAAN